VTLDAPATSVTVVDSTTITAAAPVHAAGTVDVVVTNPAGQSGRLPAGFEYVVDGPYAIAASHGTVVAGGQLSVSWTAPRAGAWDWVGLFKVGDPSTTYESGWWKYTDGVISGTLTLNAPAQPGQYEFRYLLDDGFVDTARSSPVTVR
jgi:Ca-activated chloride channel family protein